MKPSSYFLLMVNAFLALGLTILSFGYIQPKNCYNFCDPSYIIPCTQGSCAWGDQKAGWPFPVFVDAPGGGSPTSGWGRLGPEDPPIPTSMIGDVLFYSILVWTVLFIVRLIRYQAFPLKTFLVSLPLNVLLAVGLWVFYMIFTFTLGFHLIRGVPREPMYLQTSVARPFLCHSCNDDSK